MEYGKHQDEFIGVHPEIFEHYYNSEGNIIHRQTHQTGTEYPSDEEAHPSSDFHATAEASEADASEPSDSDCEEEFCFTCIYLFTRHFSTLVGRQPTCQAEPMSWWVLPQLRIKSRGGSKSTNLCTVHRTENGMTLKQMSVKNAENSRKIFLSGLDVLIRV